MNLPRAIAICDGMQKPDNVEEFVEAFQTIVDNGVAWTLPPRIGRMAWELIRANEVHLESYTLGGKDGRRKPRA